MLKKFWSSFPSKVCSILAITVLLFVVYLVVDEQMACAGALGSSRSMCGLMSVLAVGIGAPTIAALLFFGWVLDKLWNKSIFSRQSVRISLSIFSGLLITFMYVILSEELSFDLFLFLNELESKYSSLLVWAVLFLIFSFLSYLVLPKGKSENITKD